MDDERGYVLESVRAIKRILLRQFEGFTTSIDTHRRAVAALLQMMPEEARRKLNVSIITGVDQSTLIIQVNDLFSAVVLGSFGRIVPKGLPAEGEVCMPDGTFLSYFERTGMAVNSYPVGADYFTTSGEEDEP